MDFEVGCFLKIGETWSCLNVYQESRGMEVGGEVPEKVRENGVKNTGGIILRPEPNFAYIERKEKGACIFTSAHGSGAQGAS